jgi:D-arabinose 1-dehydrogenase-like Zn-dependent alcohol dehydrogenase
VVVHQDFVYRLTEGFNDVAVAPVLNTGNIGFRALRRTELARAAHPPVVWATEVLDRLARTGRPSRAEVTDAAMAQRVECVMSNKGSFVVEAVTQVDEILRRKARHQRKTVALPRPLCS